MLKGFMVDFTNIPCGLPKVSFSRGSFVIFVKIGVFTENSCFKYPMRFNGILKHLN